MENWIIGGINFKILCEQQNYLADIYWKKHSMTRYLKQKEEKRRDKERKQNIKNL
jgi:hypothetical protein